MTDERNPDAVERVIPIAEAAGLSLTHMGLDFVIAHPGVTSARRRRRRHQRRNPGPAH
jgi:aryl-alcohol dehydrogenase (NADP+)